MPPFSDAVVFIVDDDQGVREALAWLLRSRRLSSESFPSAEAFVELLPSLGKARRAGCLLLDVRMPGMSGLELQEQLITRKSSMPIVFITGHGDVPMAVTTMKKGAIDFLEKPFNETDLREIVTRMFEQANQRLSQAQAQRIHDAMLARLTAREQQVLERIVAGRLNKQIADDLGISIKTVEAHRANIMEKLQVTTVADLMKVALAKPEVNA